MHPECEADLLARNAVNVEPSPSLTTKFEGISAACSTSFIMRGADGVDPVH